MPLDSLTVLRSAALLLSEDGENPEYDRAIVELTSDLIGGPEDQTKMLSLLRDIRRYV